MGSTTTSTDHTAPQRSKDTLSSRWVLASWLHKGRIRQVLCVKVSGPRGKEFSDSAIELRKQSKVLGLQLYPEQRRPVNRSPPPVPVREYLLGSLDASSDLIFSDPFSFVIILQLGGGKQRTRSGPFLNLRPMSRQLTHFRGVTILRLLLEVVDRRAIRSNRDTHSSSKAILSNRDNPNKDTRRNNKDTLRNKDGIRSPRVGIHLVTAPRSLVVIRPTLMISSKDTGRTSLHCRASGDQEDRSNRNAAKWASGRLLVRTHRSKDKATHRNKARDHRSSNKDRVHRSSDSHNPRTKPQSRSILGSTQA
jgi:hypothetical protein